MRAPHVGVAKTVLKEKNQKFEAIFNILTSIEYGIISLPDDIEEDQKKLLIELVEQVKRELYNI